jgi:hypothetical protein
MAERLVTLRSKLAPVYGPLLSELFDRPEVVETRATCDTCAMCNHGQVAPVEMDYFKPDLKCCTYYPGLSNYLVGAILADTSEELAEGRRRLRAKIASRIGVTPNVVAAPRKYNVIYAAARGAGFFGRSKNMLCPYFDEENDGRCTVWRYREAVCSTYFCKYTAGKPGWQFWDTMKGYLSHVERSLAHYATVTVDKNMSEPQLERFALTAEDIEDRAPKDEDYAFYWGKGKWVGREEEFYIACYERVRALQRGEFEKNVDDTPDGRGLLAKLEAKYDEITKTGLPPILVRASNLKKRDAGENVVVTTYNPFDAFSMEKELFDVLEMFRPDQTVEENLARLDKEKDVQLAPELLQYLFIHGVLAAPEKPKPADAANPASTAAAAVAVAPAPVPAPKPAKRHEGRAGAKPKPKPKPKKR